MTLPRRLVYYDVGCSNGYLTDIVRQYAGADRSIGFDHVESHLRQARKTYPWIAFEHIDLNVICSDFNDKADLVTCFETLEHVGNIHAAVESLKRMLKPSGVLFVTVPIEVGWRGYIKYMIKTRLYGYKFDEVSADPQVRFQYERDLVKGMDISCYRDERSGWGTHFGFDYRKLEQIMSETFGKVDARTIGTTRFFIIRNDH